MKFRTLFLRALLPILIICCSSSVWGQGGNLCQVDFVDDTVHVQCGNSVTLTPIDGSSQFSEGFNNSQLGPDWCSNQPVNFSNPCDPSPDGTPYAWMGPVADQPRELITEEIDVSCGGQICFDFDMATQTNSAPCEGPDQPSEGVALQYSTNAGPNCNGTWTDIFYFDPDQCAGGGTGCGGGPGAAYVNWDNYCFNVPPAAQTTTTRFRFYQTTGSGPDYDHWGIDNVEITGSSCGQISQYSYDGANFDTTPDTTVSPSTNRDYTVWAVADTGAANPDTCSTTVHVNVTGVPNLDVNASDSSITCTDSIQLNASHSTAGAITYDWSPGYQMSDSTVQNPNAWPFVDTNYQVIAYSAGNPACADTGSVPISVVCDTCFAPIPELTQPSCKGNSDGMIVADLIGARPPYKVVWEDDAGNVLAQDSPVTGTDTLTGLPAGQYTVRSIDTLNCSADTTFMLGEPDSLLTTVSEDTLICRGGTAELTATPSGGNAPPYQFNWSNGLSDSSYQAVSPNSATTYDLTVEDSNGCVSPSVSVTVDLYPPIYVSTRPDDTICPGGAAQLGVLTTNGGSGSGYHYTWTNAFGDTVGNGPTTTVRPSTTMNYIVHVGDDCETPLGTDTVTISIFQGYAGPEVNMSVTPTEACHPVNAQFTCLVPSNKVRSTFWSFGDGTTSNDSGTTSHTYLEPGCYDVTLEVTSKNGCIEDSTFKNAVCARPYPNANFVMKPKRGNVLDPVLFFEDRSSGAVDYEWSFEHVDSTSSLPSLEMRFPNEDEGGYEVKQWVVNKYGCTDSITKTAIIEGVHQLYVPNAFTPDGDGHNDIFRPQGEGFSKQKYRFKIFDRWGNQVFMTKDPEEGWDGMIDGQEAPTGVYIWQIRVKDRYTDKVHNEQGHVTLIR